MSDNGTKKRIGIGELARFGEHLNSLRGLNRTFELGDEKGRFRECTLDEVIQAFQRYFEGTEAEFRVRITFIDYQGGMLSHTTTEFKKVKEPSSWQGR
jgi:hypothetical protein